MTIEDIRSGLWLFDFLKRIARLLNREEFELEFRVNDLIRDVVLVNFLPVLIENREVIQIGMAI